MSLGSPAARTRAPTLSAGAAGTGKCLSPCTRSEHALAIAMPASPGSKRERGQSLSLSRALEPSLALLSHALSLGLVARVRLTVQEDGLPLPFDAHIHGHVLAPFTPPLSWPGCSPCARLPSTTEGTN